MNGMLLEGKEPPPEEELIETHPEYPEHKKRFAAPRQFAKSFVHGTNYGGKARTMARAANTTVARAEALQSRWFAIHPGIKDWHTRVEEGLYRNRSVRNAFGFRRVYFDRIDSVLPQALAWVPQSTVAIIINKGLVNLDTNVPEVELLLQVHDSLVFQFEKRFDPAIRPKIRDNLLITVPYPDPLIIPVGLKLSDKSWGHCKEAKWEN